MQINRLSLATGSNVLLTENTLPDKLLQDLHQLYNNLDNDTGWQCPDWTQLRKMYKGNDSAYGNLRDYLNSPEFTRPIENILNVKMNLVDVDIWVDYPGMGPLLPHCEQHGRGQGQIYLSRLTHDTNGTAMLNFDKELLFTMPFRDNYGWYMDECTKVMHSRPYDVIAKTTRCSIIYWHDYL